MTDFKLDRFKYNWRGEWSASTAYIRDDVVSYGGSSFVCIHAHTSDSLFSTDLNNQDTVNNIPAPRWKKMTDGRAWRDQWQPSAVYDPGDIVSYGGNLYLCVETHQSSSSFIDNNDKWALYAVSVAFSQNWEPSTLYAVGKVIRYGGIVYRCLVEHTSGSSITDNQESWQVFYQGIEYRQDWDVDITFRVGDVVKFGASLYECKKEHTPIDDSTINFDQDEFWNLLAPGHQFRGDWDATTTYRVGDVVRHGGWLFYSLADSFNDHPVSNLYQLEKRDNPIAWEIVAKGIRFRGDWNVAEFYKTGDVVRRGGQLFTALLDTELTADGSTLDYLDDSNWELLTKGQNYHSSWKTDETYAVGDVVVFFGTSFICKIEHESDNTNFPSLDIASAGSGFVFWDVLVASGSESGLQYRGDLRTFNLIRDFYGDDSSFGQTRVPVGSNGELLSINNDNTIVYKNYGEVNRVFYVAENGIDDSVDPQAGVSPFKPYRTVRFACERADDNFDGTTTVRVRTGRFEEILPIIVPAKTAIVGDELRSTTVVAAGPVANLALDSVYTIAVLTRISQLIQSVIAGTELTVPKSPLNLLDPVVLTEIVEVEEVDFETGQSLFVETEVSIETDPQAAIDIQNLIIDIQNYINFFVNSTGTNPQLVGTNTANQDQGYVNAVKVLNANREFLKEEAVVFMKQTFPNYDFVEELCKRDVDRYIDAWAYDLIFTGNYKSLLAARYYRNAVLGSQLEDMFYLRDSTGVRNLTVAGLAGQLNPPNVNDIFRLPTGGAYVSLDPGWGPDDDRTWINDRSPYVQNVTTLGKGCVGQKIDGALHNGGNRSIVSNDFTQVIDEGIGAWVLNQGRAELVSVFSYYAHVGYLTTNGGIIRGTNGNNSYGKFGCIADGNDATEVPQTATLNNRNQQASATIFAGDFTDEIQVIEWENAGQEYTQAAAVFIGAGADANVKFEDFRDDAVHTVERLDTSDTIAQNIGGGGFIRVQNNAQISGDPNDNLTSIVIAANDPNTETEYLGCRIILTSGPGTGQYAYITAYNTSTKVVSVARESDNEPGWDHVIAGTPPTIPLTSSTAYRIEPRPIFSKPFYQAREFALGLNTNWGSIVYGETTEIYNGLEGQIGTGEFIDVDGLVAVAATFDIVKNARTYSVTVVNSGVGYRVGDEIFITGDQLGGSTPYNDLVITVTEVTDDSTNSIVAITWTGIGASGRFVAITEDGSAGLYSQDGESWPDGFNMPSSGDWTCLAAGANRFVAVKTDSNNAATSLDGINWTASSMPVNRSWKSIVYGNDKFVAIASDQNTAVYSTTGETWASSELAGRQVQLFGNAKLSTAEKKFGTASLALDGVTGTRAVVESNADFGYGTDDFTIEMWVYRTVSGATQLFYDQRTADPTNFAPVIFINSANVLIYNDGTGIAITGSTTVPLNAWSHVAVSRSGTDTRLFLNGVQQGSTFTDTNNYIATLVRIGARFNNTLLFTGFIDDLRISKGVARYTANFTVPSSAFDYDDDTTLLVSFDGDNNSTIISSTEGWSSICYGKNKFITVAGSQNIAAVSTNGISWTGVTMSTEASRNWVGIAYGNNRYVAIASTGEVLYSFTGQAETWLSSSLPEPVSSSVTWKKVRYAQGVFFALATSENGSATAFAATSPDGVVWTVRELASTATWKDVAFGNPYVEEIDSSIGKNTPMWVAISNLNVINNISTGAQVLGRVEVNAGVISAVKLWDTGSGYRNEPSLTLISPTATSQAAFQCRLADGVLTNPSWLNRGIGYRTGTTRVILSGNGFADVIPTSRFITLENFSNRPPTPGAQIFFDGNPTRYTVVTVQPLNNMMNGNNGALIRITPELRIRDNLQHATGVIIRERYSQIRITGHDFLDIGTGNFEETNYPELYSNVFFSAPEDEVREENGGRVFYTSTDQGGNFRTGELFAVEQATGIVTISADFFDLGGLSELRLGGIRVGGSGAVIREFSTDPTMSEDSNNVVPTQRAIAAFLASRLSLGGSEVEVNEIQAGQVFLGGPDRISNALGLKIVFPGIANFTGPASGISGAMLAQNMFYKSFSE